MIEDEVWNKIYEYLLGFKATREIYIKDEESCRRFVEAVFWMARSGSQWRMLPKEFGSWIAIYRRFARLCNNGIWYKMLYYFANDADMEYIIVDSTILRAHACATPKKTSRKMKDLVDRKVVFQQKFTV